MKYDCLIVGGGPAGLSAALQCKALGLSALLVTNDPSANPLAKAPVLHNYLGLPDVDGRALLHAMLAHVTAQRAADVVMGKALTAMELDGTFYLSVEQEVYQGRTLLLAPGVHRAAQYPGEDRLLGKGVSYCAVCDGMLYRGRAVAVVGLSKEAPREAEMLDRLGCKVTYLATSRPSSLPEHIPFIKSGRLEILGEDRVTALAVDGRPFPCDGVFLLRETVAPTALLPALETDQGYIRVDRHMATNLPGVFAAGDCVGPPLQIAKAVGEGQVAANSAADYLKDLAS